MEFTTIILILMWLGIRIGLGLFFKKADHAAWKAFVPVYSTIIWLKIIEKPKWWVFLSFIPVVNIVLGIGMIVELMNVFNKRSPVQHVLASLLGYIFLPYYALTGNTEYVGPVNYTKFGKGRIREWSEAIFFAVIAATIIRTFTIEAFQIPTSSMESTLKRGDFLFVSKVHYGAKAPKTPLSFPFMHHTMPFFNVPAYLDWVELPYFRLPALQDVERNDIVVFNYPMEDYRPSDKREHYIKRCVAISGDTLKVEDGKLYVNGEYKKLFKNGQMSHTYLVNRKNQYKAEDFVHANDLNEDDCQCQQVSESQYKCIIYANEKTIHKLSKKSWVKNLTPEKAMPRIGDYSGKVYPNQFGDGSVEGRDWTRDFYGPLWIPQEGATIPLTKKNYIAYERAFQYYEGNKVVSLEEVVKDYKQLLSYKNTTLKSLGNRNENDRMTLAGEIKTAHSFIKVSDEISQWSDYYFMRNQLSQPDAQPRQFKSEFLAAISDYKENYLDKEIDSCIAIVKSYNSNWVNEKGIKIQEVLTSLNNSNEYPCYVNGKIQKEYTFEQDYYFMMGDNRHNSGDSRAWGFVPADHIVGKAIFVWLSMDPDEKNLMNQIRFDRLCSFVSSDGVSRSYLWEFLIGGLILWGANKWWKKKKLNTKTPEE